MAAAFCIPAIIFLFLALILSILVTVSLPSIHRLDIARVDFHSGLGSITNLPPNFAGEFRFGIWGYCFTTFNTLTGFYCVHTGSGYPVTFANQVGATQTIHSSWIRGLAMHVAACVLTGIAFFLSFSEMVLVTLLCAIFCLLALLLSLAAFAADIALLGWVQYQLSLLSPLSQNAYPGQAFWMSMVIVISLIIATITACLGHRAERRVRRKAGQPVYPTWRRPGRQEKPPVVV